MSESLVFDIKRYAINDGPGIRVVIFFKGCNLQCSWCHNPEGISANAEKMVTLSKCIKCGTCVEACSSHAITLTAEGMTTDPDLCTVCGKCAEVCPSRAIEMSGKAMTVTEIMEIIGKEQIFFDQSGGGVTFSGGEPLLHAGMLIELLDECGRRGFHRAVDTAGHVNTKTILEVAKRTDLFLYDLKMMDAALHQKWTNVKNEMILRNLTAISDAGVPVIIRIPMIGGVNDNEQNMEQTARFIAGLNGDKKEVHLLPYHGIAQNKYLKLGRLNDFEKLHEPEKGMLIRAIEIFAGFGIKASIGG